MHYFGSAKESLDLKRFRFELNKFISGTKATKQHEGLATPSIA
jgi:hypothetical protein